MRGAAEPSLFMTVYAYGIVGLLALGFFLALLSHDDRS